MFFCTCLSCMKLACLIPVAFFVLLSCKCFDLRWFSMLRAGWVLLSGSLCFISSVLSDHNHVESEPLNVHIQTGMRVKYLGCNQQPERVPVESFLQQMEWPAGIFQKSPTFQRASSRTRFITTHMQWIRFIHLLTVFIELFIDQIERWQTYNH